MCYSWVKQKQTQEPSINDIQHIFDNQLIRENLEIVNITGGEPTLRSDLSEIIKIISRNCIHLKRIDLPTNGVNTLQILDQVERILTILLPTSIKLTVCISLDGVGETHELVRGRENIFANIEQTMEGLKELMYLYHFFHFGLNMTISKLNYHAIEEVSDYAFKKRIGINFTLSAISEIGVESIRMREKFEMNEEEKNKVALSLENLSKSGMMEPNYMQFVLKWLRTGRRNGDCAFRKGKAFLLEPNGETYLCGNFKDFRICNILKEPFEIGWKRRNAVFRSSSHRCASCVSNCYIEEIM